MLTKTHQSLKSFFFLVNKESNIRPVLLSLTLKMDIIKFFNKWMLWMSITQTELEFSLSALAFIVLITIEPTATLAQAQEKWLFDLLSKYSLILMYSSYSLIWFSSLNRGPAELLKLKHPSPSTKPANHWSVIIIPSELLTTGFFISKNNFIIADLPSTVKCFLSVKRLTAFLKISKWNFLELFKLT
uniref:hypothetical protein n=1 Tax=Pappia fissilis TaxID=1040649 RepID=UPI002A7F32DD|nr:hypothetical protein UYP79_mgp006 [Pappia fissilis]WOX61248.1 hypothetical protein [Pappia fissilis]